MTELTLQLFISFELLVETARSSVTPSIIHIMNTIHTIIFKGLVSNCVHGLS